MPNEKNGTKVDESVKAKSKTEISAESKKAATNSQPTKWIFVILLLAGFGLLFESLHEKLSPQEETQIEMQSQNNFVSQDLHEMYKKGQIPKYFFNLKSIKWSYYDNELKTQIPMESIPFRTSSEGAYNLEIDAFSSPKKNSKIAILQMNLIEVKSGNKVWELSRNYEIPKLK